MAAENPELLTVAEVAQKLGVNQQTVRNWIDRGQLNALRIGSRRIRVEKSVLEAFVGADVKAASTEPLPEIIGRVDDDALADALEQIAAGFQMLAAVVRSRGG